MHSYRVYNPASFDTVLTEQERRPQFEVTFKCIQRISTTTSQTGEKQWQPRPPTKEGIRS